MSWRRHIARIGSLVHRRPSTEELEKEIRAHL